ncbi:hypothetical protein INT43_001794 [Umbelopsis isabellina]|uniref:Sugar phosphate transporter domain-containing protein n=1 Tax=Mortierella isabellina TaxID=91625 RepID=A0A8H7PRH2_MORIS|nr:hypothetical protein INT43_001794 [Umbelopsis isabellina]
MQHHRHSRASTDEDMLLFSVQDRSSEDSKVDNRDASRYSIDSISKDHKTANETFDEQDFEQFSEDPTLLQASQESPFVSPSVRQSSNRSSKQSTLRTQSINVLWILAWYLFATFLSVYNKWMFSEKYYNFQYPLFVTSTHMLVQFTFAGLTLLAMPHLKPKKRPSVQNYLYKVCPCAVATSLDIGLSNLSLKTITLSFYTMCKSSTLAFVLIFAFLFKLEKPRLKLIGIIVVITAGVLLMVSDETDFVVAGFLEVMAGAVLGGLRWSLTEILLRKESLGLSNPCASIFYLAPVQGLVLIVISGIVEGYFNIFRSAFFLTFQEGLHTMLVILVGGVLAFLMIMSEFFLIKRTSVLTLSVCGIFKEVATITVSAIVFGDKLTIINVMGLCVTLCGIGMYNWLKFHERQSEPIEVGQERYIEEDMPRRTQLYSLVAESTPMLLVDNDYDDQDDDNSESDIELHSNARPLSHT